MFRLIFCGLVSLAFVGGRAVCDRHPTACAVAATVIVGRVIAVAEAHHGGHTHQDKQPCATYTGQIQGAVLLHDCPPPSCPVGAFNCRPVGGL